MLGPYYRLQLTSVLSFMHHITGVVLTLIGAPLAVWWLVALGQGAEPYSSMQGLLGGWFGKLLILSVLFSLSFHLLNGIRHLVWDTGHAFSLKAVYLGGWLVVAGSAVLSVGLALVML
jgi:succinate dehydrogenase / fumarate reductase cytochrome b subunit